MNTQSDRPSARVRTRETRVATTGEAPPLVSVIVPHYRDLERLDLCLASLQRQTYPRDRFEIVVADNASPEGEQALHNVVESRARLVIVHERGAGAARNGGVLQATGEILAFIDCDCTADPDWLEHGVQALAQSDFVGGRIRVVPEQSGAPLPVEAFELAFAFDNERYVKQLGFTVTANLFCPRNVFEEVGCFGVGMSEDLEWSHRARAAGYSLTYAPGAIVSHPARRTWEELVTKWRRINAETFALRSNRPFQRTHWVLRSSLLPISALAHTPKVLAAPTLSSWAQRWGALCILYRLRMWRLVNAIRLLRTAPRT